MAPEWLRRRGYVTGICDRFITSWLTPSSSALRRIRSPSSLRNSSPLFGAKASPMPAPTRHPSAKMPMVPSAVLQLLLRSSRPSASSTSSLSMSCRYFRALSPRLRMSFTMVASKGGLPRPRITPSRLANVFTSPTQCLEEGRASERRARRPLALRVRGSDDVRELALDQGDEREAQPDLQEPAGERLEQA